MKRRYFLLSSILLLTACGSETEVQSTASGQSEPETNIRAVSTPASLQHQAAVTEAVVNQQPEIAARTSDVERTVEMVSSVSEQSASSLPAGRLIGIVDAGAYRQATIDNQGEVVRLREGDDWQGWRVKAISRKKIVISLDNEEHSLLLLSEFRAPSPAENLLGSQQMPPTPVDDEAEGIAVVPQFTEAQLVELRARLMMVRGGE